MQNNTIVIGICDDNATSLQKIKSTLDTEYDYSTIRCQIIPFNDPMALIKSNYKFDVLILDVNMPQMDGFEVAAYLRSAGDDTRIIFLTIRDDLIQRAFEVKAFRYLYKGCKASDLINAINEAIEDIRAIDVIMLKHPVSKEKYMVSIKDIIYIESLGQGSVAHCLESYYLSTWQLKEWQSRFSRLLGRPHRTYLINFIWLAKMGTNSLTLKNGVEIPISARNHGILKDSLKEYVHRFGKEL